MVNPASLAGPVVGAVGPFLESSAEVGRVPSAEADGEFGALLQGLVPAALATATSPAIAAAKGLPSTSTAPATPDLPANFRDAMVANANLPEAATSIVNEKIIMPSDLVRDSMPAASKEIVDRRMVEPRTEQRRESLRGAGEEPFTPGMLVPGSLPLLPSRPSPLAAATPVDPPTRRGAAQATSVARGAIAEEVASPPPATETFDRRAGEFKLSEPRVGEPRMAEPRLGAGRELPRTRSEGPAIGMGVAPAATAVTVAAATLADTSLRAAASLPSEPARRPAAGDLPRPPAAADMRAAEIFEPRVGEPRMAEPRMGDLKLAEPRTGEPRMAEPRLGAGLELPRTRSEGPAIRGAAILAQPTQIASDSRPLTAAVDPGRVPPREPAPAVFEALRYESLRRPAGSKEAATRSMNVGAASLAAANAAATASANAAASQPGLMPVAAPSIMAPPAPQVAEPLQRNEIDLESDTWKENLTELVVNLVAAEDTETVVKLSPEHLGDLEVGVSIRNGEANVSFASGIAETRVALEQALPRLRELMGQAGLELAHAGVHSSLAGGSERRQEFSTGAAPAVVPRNEVEAADESAARTAEPGDERPGGIDLYA